MVVGEAPGCVALGQVPEVLAVGYARSSPGVAPVHDQLLKLVIENRPDALIFLHILQS